MKFLKNFKKKIMNKEVKKLVTHNGSFHTDDIFATATLMLLLDKRGESYEVVRTRDSEIIKTGDYVYDVGGEYNVENNRFDHHQMGGAGKRENGIEYSSFGLIWKHFGLELCDGDKDVWTVIDNKIASPVDADDNGQDIIGSLNFADIGPYAGSQPFMIFSPTWKETDSNTYEIFTREANNFKRVLDREIKVAKDETEGRRLIKADYDKAEDKRIVELSNSGYSRYLYQDTLSRLGDIIYIVYKSEHSDTWKVEAISKNPATHESRKLFPLSWRGAMADDGKLIKETGVSDAEFCHRNGFLLTVGSREGAIKLAQIAVES